MITVAIVEDEEANTRHMKSMLEQFGKENDISFVISCFSNGINFISNYTANYDLVFMDIDMPHMNGLETAEAVNAIGKGNMHFVTFDGGPHAIWEAAITFKGSGDLPALEDWLFSQKRGGESDGGCRSSVNMRGISLILLPVASAIVVIRFTKKKKAQ